MKTHYLADYVSRLETEVTLLENDNPHLDIDILFPPSSHVRQNAAVTRSKADTKRGPKDQEPKLKRKPDTDTGKQGPEVIIEPKAQQTNHPVPDCFQDLDWVGIVKCQTEDEICNDIISYLKDKNLPEEPLREKLTLTSADHMAIKTIS